MKRIFINEDNLRIEDLDYEVIRVKGIVVNQEDEVLLVHNNNTFQFPGGHLEKDEDMELALEREIKEETGICVDSFLGPFMQITSYMKNYFGSDKNVCSKIYYYRIISDELPNIRETQYDELEKMTDFQIHYVPILELEDFLKNSMKEQKIDINIGKEMLFVLEEYDRLFSV